MTGSNGGHYSRSGAGPASRGPLVDLAPVVVHDADAPLPADFDDFTAACSHADDHAPFGEHTLLTLHGQRQVRHARIVCHLDGALAGYAVLSEGIDAWYLELAVAPPMRGRRVGSALREAALRHIRSHGGGSLRAWAHSGGPVVDHLLRGWTTSRTLQVLQTDLTRRVLVPAVPPGVTARCLDVTSAAERDAWLALSNDAFQGHPENGGWDRAEVDWRMAAPWTDSNRFPVLEDHQTGLLAGVWTKAEQGHHPELYVVAVAPRAQGRGLGMTVVCQALGILRDHGFRKALLYVDTDNQPARSLYAKVGFTLQHVDSCYQLDVPADD